LSSSLSGIQTDGEEPHRSWDDRQPPRAIRGKDMFANQNSACRLTHARARHVLTERSGFAD
jgi:hypothetical protein